MGFHKARSQARGPDPPSSNPARVFDLTSVLPVDPFVGCLLFLGVEYPTQLYGDYTPED